jgi:hypothetical protein
MHTMCLGGIVFFILREFKLENDVLPDNLAGYYLRSSDGSKIQMVFAYIRT